MLTALSPTPCDNASTFSHPLVLNWLLLSIIDHAEKIVCHVLWCILYVAKCVSF